ncbi:carboxypeptidase-like regulatory domain-containing protein [Lutibacter sp.]|uniref:carboxypeptidase-like regulatory domain-containing protein n=1 Tax=Lutibacter sp. TaxID=1925666 RepID=UPI001A2A0FB3|nr:carboxypeptidase-like regulatory domain-containing protein [Lutibacter sp.]MBI9041139.1 carboxypeptidase-like regulatory domain-containing protein [Lutibacter sp.]
MPLKNKNVSIALFFMVVLSTTYAQQQEAIHGIVKSEATVLQDINIINKTKNLGTSSNANGEFTMHVSEGDSIQFSSINYKTRIIAISLNHLKTKQIIIFLEPGLNELDEIAIEQKVRLDFGKVALPKDAIFEKDEIDLKAAPNARNLTDPTSPAGSNTGNILGVITLISDIIFEKSRERKKEEKKMVQLQQNFSNTILDKYGEEFFTKGLNIHKNDVYLFIDFCNDNGLKEYYLSDEFTTKNFIVLQSKKFLEIKKQ